MKLLTPLKNLLSAFGHWLRVTPNVSHFAFILAGWVLILLQQKGYIEKGLPYEVTDFSDLPRGWTPGPLAVPVAGYVLSFLKVFLVLGGVVYALVIVRVYPNAGKMVAPTWVASVCVTLWALADSLRDRWAASLQESFGQEFSLTAYVIFLVMMVIMFMSPPLALMYFKRCKIMERYVMTSFLQPLIFCLLGFLSLWVVMDLKDNLAQFQENHIPMRQILMFYLKLLPYIYVSVAPVTLLLATLYSLGKMSRSNELISMLGAGKSMGQVLRPVFMIGIYASFVGMSANYEWAPVAEGNKKTLLQDVKDKMSKNIMALGIVYRNNEDHRTWFIGVVPYDLHTDDLGHVTVREEDSEGHLVRYISARSANWSQNGVWTFFSGAVATYKNGQVDTLQAFESLPDSYGKARMAVSGWSESPWVLMSGSVTPEFLGVPELLSYITANKAYDPRKLAPFYTHFFYRFAMPLQGLVIVLIAAPLGVVYSRRGLLGGVASSVFIFFILLFIDSFFLNMGKGSRMPPWLAPWIPHMLLGTVGGILFYFRSQNRDFPKLTNWRSMMEAAGFLWEGVCGLCMRAFSGKWRGVEGGCCWLIGAGLSWTYVMAHLAA